MDARLNSIPRAAAERLFAFKREVERALPGRVTGMTLFGSRARGQAAQDSDYDVAVFVRDLSDRFEVLDLLSDLAYPHMLEGFCISPIELPDDYLDSPRGRTALAEDIDKYGVPLP